MGKPIKIILDSLKADCKNDIESLEHYVNDIKAFTGLENNNSKLKREPVDKYGNSSLHIAAKKGHLNVAVVLIGLGFNPGIKNQFGNTPLHEAASWGHDEICRLLVKEGAKVDDPNDFGVTALEYWNSVGKDFGDKEKPQPED